MEIKLVTGCINDSLTIDGVESIDMDIEKVKNAIKKLIDSEQDVGVLQSTLMDFVEMRGDYEDLGTCEECGDTITQYTLNI
jgi:hypothetical protein